MTKIEKVLKALQSGKTLTARQIESRYNVGNARSLISSLRLNHGHTINCVPGKNGTGSYVLAETPRRKRAARKA